MRNQKITIVGGMGPQASASLHTRLIQRAAELGARNGDEFPEIRHLSLPIRDFISDPSLMPLALSRITAALECLYLWRRRTNCYSL